MSPDRLRRQACNDGPWLVQHHTAPMPLPATLASMLAKALRSRLAEFGYLIPRAEWVRRYPAQALTASRFAEFMAADVAWRMDHPDGKPLPFEPRWTPFMPTPAGHRPPYRREGDAIMQARPDGTTAPLDAPDLAGFLPGQVEAAIQLLNSGWSPAEAAVLLAPEPVEPA